MEQKRGKPLMRFWGVLSVVLAGIGILIAGVTQTAEILAKSQAIDASAAANFCYIDAQVTEDEILHLEIDFEKENGQYIYEVEFDTDAAHYEYNVNASDGTILSGTVKEFPGKQKGTAETDGIKESVDLQKETTQDQKKTYMSVDRAKKIAVKDSGQKFSEVTFSKAKLEEDDGQMIYEIEFYTNDRDYDYEIDAHSGEILEASSEVIGKEDQAGQNPVIMPAAPGQQVYPQGSVIDREDDWDDDWDDDRYEEADDDWDDDRYEEADDDWDDDRYEEQDDDWDDD